MTISTTNSVVSAVGDGNNVDFFYNYPMFVESWMSVTIDFIPVLDTEYIVDLDLQKVTFNTAPGAGLDVTLARIVPETQLVDYQVGDSFPANTHEAALDKLTMITQQQNEIQSRSIVAPLGEAGLNLTLPPASVRIGEYLAFDAVTGEVITKGGTASNPNAV